ncbi:MAG: TIGR00159 family protein [Anaerolineaceae bacterium]|nr:MAG: TIGR00159 family protein [Anaerolineaceae bacterium]
MEFIWAIENLTSSDLVDIFIVALLFFALTFLFRGTQAMVLVRGTVVLLVGLIVISSVFQFRALGWVLANALTVLAVAIPVIFQPELRRGLERLGRGSMLFNMQAPDSLRTRIIAEICQAAERLSERRHGALIVLQRNSPLEEYIRTGSMLDSDVNAQILLTLFWPKTELHDGAVIIDKNGRIASAASVLPLTANRNLPSRKMGTRHRAALGISEVSDALCVVVSEETGKIAITNGGRMVARLDSDRLRTILTAFYGPRRTEKKSLRARLQERVSDLFGIT